MPASLPVRPFGNVTLTTFSSCCPSGRAILTWNGLYFPALELSDFAVYAGEKGRSASVFGQAPPPGLLVRVKLLDGVFWSRLPDHGVKSVFVVFGPQIF